ncbi:hypothetical protein HF289_02950 [Acidithiobacillus ferrooxidans]|nr:hypothetical protein [Acidithiobacillus ferrooxidans]MBU2860140.1 hypothetical protein [Acidithiobacillus ferrooxidans]
MPVKKLGSKLAQGVRQVQAQQVEESAPIVDACAAAAPDAQPNAISTVRAGGKPPPSSNSTEEKRPSAPRSEHQKRLHPRRVWPD